MVTRANNVLENTRGCSRDGVRLLMAYDGSGRRVSKTRMRKERDDETELNYFGARYLDPMLGLWISVDAARQYDSPYTYVGNNPIILTDPDGNIGLLGAAASTPSAFVNLVSAEKKSMEQGNSYAAVVRDCLEAFAVTLIIGAFWGPETAWGKALVNAGASAAMNVHDQVTIEHKSLKDVDVEEAAMQSRNGFVAGAIGAGAGSFASKPLLGKTAEFVDGFVGSAVGSAAAVGAEIVKNKNQNE